ncbi:hypothetical protein Syun_004283 [Stephania yunnanensis]|uniref:Uncharacterized protein n=1 Tax=Stephania yunnanensis TaxID=152371 RepID=A0AAP0L329_9MAGN
MFDSSSPDLSRHLSRDLGRSLSRGLVTPVYVLSDLSFSHHCHCSSCDFSLGRAEATLTCESS